MHFAAPPRYEITIIGDDIFYKGELVAKIVATESSIREVFSNFITQPPQTHSWDINTPLT